MLFADILWILLIKLMADTHMIRTSFVDLQVTFDLWEVSDTVLLLYICIWKRNRIQPYLE